MRQHIGFDVGTRQSLGEAWSRRMADRGCRPLGFRDLFTVVIVLLGLAICGPIARAQSGAGSIQGTVTDSSGAVVPGASIHVVNQATGVVTDSKSNSIGFYQVPELFTGTYVVTITAPGMKALSQSLELLVGQNVVINASLPAGSVTQQVTVNANAVQLVTTNSGTLSATLENARINELPMNGRSIMGLIEEATPGLETCSGAVKSLACSNGQQQTQTELEIDGVTTDNLDYGAEGPGELPDPVADPDAVQEVRVETTDSGAEYARPTTAVLTTKSGTNQLHGSLFETSRNSDFGIARTRSNLPTYVAPELIRNEFGGSVGGPIVIPHLYHGKDKSFFFFSYERLSVAQGVLTNESVPTQAMRLGDFSGLVNSSGVLQELYDPNTTQSSTSCPEPASAGTAAPADTWCRMPFGGDPATGSTYNYIPPSRESPTAVILNQMWPMPTNANNPLLATNYVQAIPEPEFEPQFTFRLDHVFSEKNRAYLRYTEQNLSLLGPSTTGDGYNQAVSTPSFTIPADASNDGVLSTRMYMSALGFTHIFSPAFVSETVLSLEQYARDSVAVGSPGTDYESDMGLPNNFGEGGLPNVANIVGVVGGQQWGYGMTQKIPSFSENLTKTVGKHELLFGGRYRLEEFGMPDPETRDQISFSGLGTGLENPSSPATSPTAYANSGQINADEFIGSASGYTVHLEPPYLHIREMDIDGYLQDNYHIARNLMLNLGVRYEAHPATWVGQGAMMGFDFKAYNPATGVHGAFVTTVPTSQLIAEGLTTQAIINNDKAVGMTFETPAEANLPPMLTKNYNFIWLPRIGVAWQPFGKWGTVVRGGLGKYIFPTPMYEDYEQLWKVNPFDASYSESYDNAAYAPDSISNYQLRSVQNASSNYSYTTTLAGGGTPVMGVNTANAVNSSAGNGILPGIQAESLAPDFAPSAVEEANFTIEQPLKWNSALSLSYVYTRGINLHDFWFFNDWPSEFSWEVQQGTTVPNSSVYGPTYSGTAEGPFDNITYSYSSDQSQQNGWSNYNALQVNYQKLYHSGVAWQVSYIWSKSMRAGTANYTGNATDAVDPYSTYINSYVGNYINAGANTVTYAPEGGTFGIKPNLPPPPPAGVPVWGYYKALNRWENYMVDTNNPPQHLKFNGLVDLPFGRGKRWLGNVNKGMNELVGGWQLAGAGSLTAQDFAITSTNGGPTASTGAAGKSIHVYKKSMPITDCRSGICRKGYEWWNGYIPPTTISGNTCAAQSGGKVVSGLSSSWVPYVTPIDTICTATTTDKYYGQNDVIMNGVTGQAANAVITYGVAPLESLNGIASGGFDAANPFSHTVLNGPTNFEADTSLFKVFPITERVLFRMTVDAFNVFNIQGLPNPSGADGTLCYSAGGVGCTSYNAARQLQFSARLTF